MINPHNPEFLTKRPWSARPRRFLNPGETTLVSADLSGVGPRAPPSFRRRRSARERLSQVPRRLGPVDGAPRRPRRHRSPHGVVGRGRGGRGETAVRVGRADGRRPSGRRSSRCPRTEGGDSRPALKKISQSIKRSQAGGGSAVVAVGAWIEALYRGKSPYLPAKVTSVRLDGSLDLEFENGKKGSRAPPPGGIERRAFSRLTVKGTPPAIPTLQK